MAWKRGKFVATIHDVKPLLFPVLRARTNLISRIEQWLVGDRWKKIDHVITISEHSRRDLLAHVPLRPEQVTVTSLGLDTERFRPAEHRGRASPTCSVWPEPIRPRTSASLSTRSRNFLRVLRSRFDLLLAGDVCKRPDIRAAVEHHGSQRA
ncbi:MAG: glycosyltransferase [Nitrospira sp.]|nr:glycosyltransferase [Nitrospira sp.]